jgi:hypothetical protein
MLLTPDSRALRIVFNTDNFNWAFLDKLFPHMLADYRAISEAARLLLPLCLGRYTPIPDGNGLSLAAFLQRTYPSIFANQGPEGNTFCKHAMFSLVFLASTFHHHDKWAENDYPRQGRVKKLETYLLAMAEQSSGMRNFIVSQLLLPQLEFGPNLRSIAISVLCLYGQDKPNGDLCTAMAAAIRLTSKSLAYVEKCGAVFSERSDLGLGVCDACDFELMLHVALTLIHDRVYSPGFMLHYIPGIFERIRDRITAGGQDVDPNAGEIFDLTTSVLGLAKLPSISAAHYYLIDDIMLILPRMALGKERISRLLEVSAALMIPELPHFADYCNWLVLTAQCFGIDSSRFNKFKMKLPFFEINAVDAFFSLTEKLSPSGIFLPSEDDPNDMFVEALFAKIQSQNY